MNLATQTRLILLLLSFVIAFGWVAKRIGVPYPIVLVIAGLGFSLIPQIPRISMSPNFIFLAVLPPLLFSTAFNTSWRDFRYHLVSILSLAFGLVGFTVIGIAVIAHMLLPWFDWRLGLLLGAIAAPTDAIAATAIAKRIGLPQRIIEILEGESLVNDASGLLALEFATAFVVTGHTPEIGEGALRLVVLMVVGIAVGLAVGQVVHFCEKHIDDGPIEVTLTFVTPFVAYMGAEALHGSGVLAAVAAGFYLGNRSSYFFSSEVRLQARGFWSTFGFVLNGIVFLLIGLQLPYILVEMRGMSAHELWFDTIEFVGAVIVLRLLWVFPAERVAYWVRRRLRSQNAELASVRETFVLGWTGMRGALSLAAAISLPEVLENGQPFPQRNVIIFLTFSLIFVTLVIQGLSLSMLIKGLGLAGLEGEDPEAISAKRQILEAALGVLQQMRDGDDPTFQPLYENIASRYRLRLANLKDNEDEPGDGPMPEMLKRYRQISVELRQVERAKALELRAGQQISDYVLREIEYDLDLQDARVR